MLMNFQNYPTSENVFDRKQETKEIFALIKCECICGKFCIVRFRKFIV